MGKERIRAAHPRVVILGGGFAGLEATFSLRHKRGQRGIGLAGDGPGAQGHVNPLRELTPAAVRPEGVPPRGNDFPTMAGAPARRELERRTNEWRTPERRRPGDQPDAPARGLPSDPRWRFGLLSDRAPPEREAL
ncbi:MAG TPA: hypothetical protein VFF52_03640 [Isosphaeraceae bacterium]|nr:hypothetical protein [Isosphaeraceae bacterium]